MARKTRSVSMAIEAAANRYGLDPAWMTRIAEIESGGNPNVVSPGGSYKGLFQLSDSEFRRMMGRGGDINNPSDNALAAARLLASHKAAYVRQFGTEPTLPELYMIHQQGWGGFLAHKSNPDRPAWENMASTREGQQRGADWAKLAISGNVPRGNDFDVNTGTSRDFLAMWERQVAGAPVTNTYAGQGLDDADRAATATPTVPSPTPKVASTYNPVGPSGKTLGDVIGAGLEAAGKGISRSASVPTLPQSGPLIQSSPEDEQDVRAFALPQSQRRRQLG